MIRPEVSAGSCRTAEGERDLWCAVILLALRDYKQYLVYSSNTEHGLEAEHFLFDEPLLECLCDCMGLDLAAIRQFARDPGKMSTAQLKRVIETS